MIRCTRPTLQTPIFGNQSGYSSNWLSRSRIRFNCSLTSARVQVNSAAISFSVQPASRNWKTSPARGSSPCRVLSTSSAAIAASAGCGITAATPIDRQRRFGAHPAFCRVMVLRALEDLPPRDLCKEGPEIRTIGDLKLAPRGTTKIGSQNRLHHIFRILTLPNVAVQRRWTSRQSLCR